MMKVPNDVQTLDAAHRTMELVIQADVAVLTHGYEAMWIQVPGSHNLYIQRASGVWIRFGCRKANGRIERYAVYEEAFAVATIMALLPH
jgi:hypothetical protein